ncbi:MAG: hypothetical protein ACTSUE_18830, partial [Promethearchaeota archaeon]
MSSTLENLARHASDVHSLQLRHPDVVDSFDEFGIYQHVSKRARENTEEFKDEETISYWTKRTLDVKNTLRKRIRLTQDEGSMSSPNNDPDTTVLNFQIFTAEESCFSYTHSPAQIQKSLYQYRRGLGNNNVHQETLEDCTIPEILLFGKTLKGDTVCARVRNTPIEVYMSIPQDWVDEESIIHELQQQINSTLQ